MAISNSTKNLQDRNDAGKTVDNIPTEGQKKKRFTFLDDYKGGSVSTGPAFDKNYNKFFKSIMDVDAQNLEGQAGNLQSGVAKLAKFPGRVAVKVGSELAQLPGYVYGLGDWALTGFDSAEIDKMVNNGWITAIQNAEEEIKKTGAFDIFTPDHVRNGTFLDNLGSASFWAQEGADAIGFFLSMLVPGQLIRAGGVGAKVTGALRVGGKAAKGINAAKNVTKLGAIAGPASKLIKPGTRMAGLVDDVAATGLNTIYESGAEAGEAYREAIADGLTPEEAGQVASKVYKANLGVLSISNALEQKFLFNAFSKIGVTRGGKKTALSRIIGKDGKLLATPVARPKYSKAGTFAKRFFAGAVSEGMWEEGSQYVLPKFYREQLEAGNDQGIVEDFVDLLTTYADNLSEVDMQKSMFLGAMLGTGMGGIRTIQEFKNEDRLLSGSDKKTASKLGKFFGQKDRAESPGLAKLYQDNYINRVRSMEDLATRDKDGNIVYTEVEGEKQIKLDPLKIKELGSQALMSTLKRNQLLEFAEEGNKEAYDKLKFHLDMDYMFPFFTQPGGIDILTEHINHIAELDAEEAAKYGLPGAETTKIKDDLLFKAKHYQKIYNQVLDSHNLSNVNKIDYTKNQKQLFEEFKNRVGVNKFEAISNQDYVMRRAYGLMKELSSFEKGGKTIPITSSSNDLTQKTVTELRESLRENSSKLNAIEKNELDNKIKALDIYIAEANELTDTINKFHNKAKLQENFDEYVASSKEAEKQAEEIKSSSTDEVTNETNNITDSPLKTLYEKSTLVTPYKDNIKNDYNVTYRAKNKFTLTSENEKPLEFEGEFLGSTQTGDLKAIDLNNKQIFYLSSENTANYKGKQYSVTMEETKSAQQVKDETEIEQLITITEHGLRANGIAVKDSTRRFKKANQYIEKLEEKLDKILRDEAASLTKYGTRLNTAGQRRTQRVNIGKNQKAKSLNSDDIRKELLSATEARNELTSFLEILVRQNEYLKAQYDALNSNQKILFEETLKLVTEQKDNLQKELIHVNNKIEDSTTYRNNLNRQLRNGNITAAKILNVEQELRALREAAIPTEDPRTGQVVGMTDDQLNSAENELLANAYKEAILTDDDYQKLSQLDEFGTLLQNRIDDINGLLIGLEQTRLYQEIELKAIEALDKMNNDVLRQLNKDVIGRAKVEGRLSIGKDFKAASKLTPEVKLDIFELEELEITRDYEEDVKTPFFGVESFFTTQGNQLKAKDNDDLTRWYTFLYSDARQTIKDGPRKGMWKYSIQLMSYTALENQINAGTANKEVVDRLRFYTGKKNGLLTYDEIQNLPNNTTAIENAKTDIKSIVVNNSPEGNYVFANKQGHPSRNGTELLYTSIAESSAKTTNNYDRFSFTKLADSIEKEVKSKTPDISKKDLADMVEQEVGILFEEAQEQYIEFRNKIIQGETTTLEIAGITPGKKNIEDADSINLLEATGLTTKELKYQVFHLQRSDDSTFSDKFTDRIAGSEVVMRKGFLYMTHNNRVEGIKPKTLKETNSTPQILNMFRALATTRDKTTSKKIDAYLRNVLYFNSKEITPYSLSTIYKEGKLKEVIFGEGNIISSNDLENGINTSEFYNFLDDKRWNFDKALVSGNVTFFEETTKEVNGKVELGTQKKWTSDVSGYRGFLFSPSGQTPKGTIYVSPIGKSWKTKVTDGQYLNQKLILNSANEKITKNESNTATGVGKVVDMMDILNMNKSTATPNKANEADGTYIIRGGKKFVEVSEAEEGHVPANVPLDEPALDIMKVVLNQTKEEVLPSTVEPKVEEKYPDTVEKIDLTQIIGSSEQSLPEENC